MHSSTQQFLANLILQLTPLIKKRSKIFNFNESSMITSLKLQLQSKTIIFHKMSSTYEEFCAQVNSVEYSDSDSWDMKMIISSLTILLNEFYFNQRLLMEEGRMKALKILKSLEGHVEQQLKNDVDKLTEMLSDLSMEDEGATGSLVGAVAASFSIPEGETDQESQEDEKTQ